MTSPKPSPNQDPDHRTRVTSPAPTGPGFGSPVGPAGLLRLPEGTQEAEPSGVQGDFMSSNLKFLLRTFLKIKKRHRQFWGNRLKVT